MSMGPIILSTQSNPPREPFDLNDEISRLDDDGYGYAEDMAMHDDMDYPDGDLNEGVATTRTMRPARHRYNNI